MRKADLVRIILKAAHISGRSEFVVIGSQAIHGTLRHLSSRRVSGPSIFPEIHDLVVSKVAIGRDKDLMFLDGVIELGIVDRNTLLDRYPLAPRLTQERLDCGLAAITAAFDRRHDQRRSSPQR